VDKAYMRAYTHWVNHYQADSVVCLVNTHLSTG